MTKVEQLHVYALPWHDGDVPLLADGTGHLAPPDLYTIDASANAAGLEAGIDYGLTIGPATDRNRPARSHCVLVPPPAYVLFVPTPDDDN